MFLDLGLLWKEAPFLKLLPPFVTGIVVTRTGVLPGWLDILMVLVVCGFLSFSLFLKTQLRFGASWLVGLCLNLLIFETAGWITKTSDKLKDADLLVSSSIYGGYYVGELKDILADNGKTIKGLFLIKYRIQSNRIYTVSNSCNVSFKIGESTKKLLPGTTVLFDAAPVRIKNPGNPGEFDYVAYCSLQQLYLQVSLSTAHFVIINSAKRQWLNNFLFVCREKICSILRKYITKKESGMAQALMVGYKNDLDNTLVQAYSNSGVVHIIAISGLHLSLLFEMIELILVPLKKIRFGKYLSSVLALIILWTFSLLSGGSPSVIRSAVMFCCIISGRLLAKKMTIYNSLAASAFLLLCYNPLWWWDAGFELSYAALFGIVIFNKPIYNAFYFKNALLNAIWKLVSVTLAAQTLTVPLCIYLFHQLPVYFLPANLVAVPLSSIVLIGEIFLCTISPIEFLAGPVGKTVGLLIRIMNNFIERTASLPFSVLDHFSISIVQMILLYIAIFCFCIWSNIRYPILLFLVTLTTFMVIHSYSFFQASKQLQLLVMNIPGRKAICFIEGRTANYLGDDSVYRDAYLRKKFLAPMEIKLRLSAVRAITQTGKTGIYHFGSETILLIDHQLNLESLNGQLKADFIILSNNVDMQIGKLYALFHCNSFVFDCSNRKYRVDAWLKECHQLHISGYSVSASGAFVMTPD